MNSYVFIPSIENPLVSSREHVMKVWVKRLASVGDGGTDLVEYDLEENDTVDEFKFKIQERIGIGVDRLTMIYSGKVIRSFDRDTQQENKMSKYNIQGGSTIVLVLSKEESLILK